MPKKCCDTCMYMRKNTEQPETGPAGWCCRFPPTVMWIDPTNVPGAQGQPPDVHSFMPAVQADLWCGEYKAKPASRKKKS